MKILLLTDGIWPYVIGGMQKHSFFLCKYLAAKGVHVHLIHTNGQKQYDINKLEFFTDDEKKFIKSTVLQLPEVSGFPGHYILQSYRYSKDIFQRIKNEINEYDFIYAKGLTSWYLLNQNIERPKVGINIHGYEFLQPQANFRSRMESKIFGYPFKLINKKADIIFSYGGGITDLIKTLGVPSEKIISVPGAIENSWVREKIHPSNTIRQFVFVGRFERRKGIQEINQVLLSDDINDNYHFHFVGPIPEDKRVKSGKVTYYGSIVDKEKLQTILDGCDVLVCPSYAEGMPNVILEGMSRGCSIIATDVGAVRSFIDEKVGWLIEPGNLDQLTKSLNEAIKLSTDELDLKRNASLNRVKENLVWEKIIDKTLELIKQKSGIE